MSSSTSTSAEIPWTLPPHNTYIFRHANIVDPLEGVVHPNCTVTTHAGRILHVEHSTSDQPGGSPQMVDADGDSLAPIVVDLTGKYLCPGLIDCHVHLNAVPGEASLTAMKALHTTSISLRSARLAQQMLARGFTSARDCGGTSLAFKEALRDGVVSGPRLFIAGHQLTQTGGHGDIRTSYNETECCGGHVFGSSRLCDGVPECLRVARDELRRGAGNVLSKPSGQPFLSSLTLTPPPKKNDFIKIMGGGGISSPTDAIDSVQFSPEEIQAFVGVAKRGKTYVTCHAYTPASIRNAVENGVDGIEHGNLLDAETAALMAARDVFLTPTLATYSAIASPRYVSFVGPAGAAKNEQVLHAGLDAIRLADAAGVTICFGTDLLGPMAHLETSEFALRAQVLLATKILQSATTNAARRLMREDCLGQVKPGFFADLLVLGANPLEGILVLDRPERFLLAVLKEGRVCVSRWSRMPVEVDPPLGVIE